MTRFVLTLLIGLVVSLGAVVSSGPVLSSILPSEKAIVEQHVSKFWSPPVGLSNDGGLIVDVILSIDAKGNVLLAEIVESFNFKSNKRRRIMAEEAIRTIYKASPLPLPLEKAELWVGKDIIFKFDPSKFIIDGGLAADMAAARGPKSGNSADKKPDQATLAQPWQLSLPLLSFEKKLSDLDDSILCKKATMQVSWAQGRWALGFHDQKYVQEAKRRGLTCGVGETTQTASAPVAKAKTKVTSAALTAAEKEAERLRQRVAALEAEKAKQQQIVSGDTQVPLITIIQSGADGRKGSVKGYAKDNVRVAEVLIDGQAVRVDNDGSFEWSGFVPATGKEITIEAIDTAALSSTKTVTLERGQIQQASGPRFDVLDPTAGKKVKRNSNALALIVGISDYKRTDALAVYADKDAQYFHDYASLKLGIPDSNIKTMVNAKAEQGDVILAVKDWMRRSSKPGKTDVYVFFAGHGLASQDGEQMYLLPYDGRPRLLDDTAIARERLFSDIASANPRSVTVFLDTCYSGTTRGTDMLIASRPIAIKALKQSVPDNFTVMTAARGDQTAKPLEEAKHGMFSYFLMKGMEGEADQNSDNKITAGELHSYVQQHVVQQSSGSQTPELQGDAERVLVRFQ